LPRFVDEVEQVRRALGLDESNLYLFGHSWGGTLAIEYALAYPQHLKGVIVSNMMASMPAYNEYTRTTLMPLMDPAALTEIKRLEAAGLYDDPRYMQLLMEHYYVEHILRMPADQWPEPMTRMVAHLNPDIYVPMQGPSELGVSGALSDWDRTDDLDRIAVPTLFIGARYDTMDPANLEMLAGRVQRGRYLFCPQGSHFSIYDDQKVYVAGVLRFLRDVDAGRL